MAQKSTHLATFAIALATIWDSSEANTRHTFVHQKPSLTFFGTPGTKPNRNKYTVAPETEKSWPAEAPFSLLTTEGLLKGNRIRSPGIPLFRITSVEMQEPSDRLTLLNSIVFAIDGRALPEAPTLILSTKRHYENSGRVGRMFTLLAIRKGGTIVKLDIVLQ